MAESGLFRYSVFGLRVLCCVEAGQMLPADFVDADADVVVRFGDVPERLKDVRKSGVRYQAGPGECLFEVDDVARYWVRAGREIVIERVEGADVQSVRLYLLGTAMCALLHQRGLLVLHGSVVVRNGVCVAFLGRSGVGKSTLAAAFGRRGFEVVSDDICAVSFDGVGGEGLVLPGFGQFKLWVDSLKCLGEDPEAFDLLHPDLLKRAVPIETFCDRALPLKDVFVLLPRGSGELVVERVEGTAKVHALLNNTNRRFVLDGFGLRGPHLRACGRLAGQVVMRRVLRPQVPFMLDELVRAVENELSGVGVDISGGGQRVVSDPVVLNAESAMEPLGLGGGMV